MFGFLFFLAGLVVTFQEDTWIQFDEDSHIDIPLQKIIQQVPEINDDYKGVQFVQSPIDTRFNTKGSHDMFVNLVKAAHAGDATNSKKEEKDQTNRKVVKDIVNEGANSHKKLEQSEKVNNPDKERPIDKPLSRIEQKNQQIPITPSPYAYIPTINENYKAVEQIYPNTVGQDKFKKVWDADKYVKIVSGRVPLPNQLKIETQKQKKPQKTDKQAFSNPGQPPKINWKIDETNNVPNIHHNSVKKQIAKLQPAEKKPILNPKQLSTPTPIKLDGQIQPKDTNAKKKTDKPEEQIVPNSHIYATSFDQLPQSQRPIPKSLLKPNAPYSSPVKKAPTDNKPLGPFEKQIIAGLFFLSVIALVIYTRPQEKIYQKLDNTEGDSNQMFS